MMTMNIRKNRPASVTIRSEVCELGDRLSFLDVLAQACARNARYTLTVESGGASYTILVDRGGPFNASGGGTTGSPSLVHAAQLRSGRCSLTQGWPIDQPMYQPGLDMTLKALLNGAVEPASLPRHRGVDSLRNAEFRDAHFSTAVPPDAYQRPAEVPSDRERLLASIPAIEAPRPAAQQGSWKVVETAPPVTFSEPTVANPAMNEGHENGTREAARKMATRALLWMVEVDEPADHYTLKQAASMARRGLVGGIGDMVHPLKRDLGDRLHRVQADWEHSGEVAARRTRRSRPRRADVRLDSDPDQEFRLR